MGNAAVVLSPPSKNPPVYQQPLPHSSRSRYQIPIAREDSDFRGVERVANQLNRMILEATPISQLEIEVVLTDQTSTNGLQQRNVSVITPPFVRPRYKGISGDTNESDLEI